MPVFITHKYRAIFVHLQRTGGNSIQKVFETHDPGLIETIAPHPSHKRTKHCYVSDIAAAVDPQLFRDYTKFAVVRDPLERLVSWYAHLTEAPNPGDLGLKIVGGSYAMNLYQRGIAALAGHWRLTLAYRRAWARLAQVLQPGSPLEVALRFEKIGAEVMDEVKRLAPNFDAFVRLPREHPGGAFERFYTNQVDYLSAQVPFDGSSPLLVDHVLRFETLSDDFAALAARLDFPGRLPHVNASRRDLANAAAVSPSTREAIARRFARDYETFGYPI